MGLWRLLASSQRQSVELYLIPSLFSLTINLPKTKRSIYNLSVVLVLLSNRKDAADFIVSNGDIVLKRGGSTYTLNCRIHSLPSFLHYVPF